MMLLVWCSMAIAQDTIMYDENGYPVVEEVYEDDEAYDEGEEGEAAQPVYVPNKVTTEESNEPYYSRELEKKELDRKRWEEVTKGINYMDDVREPEKKKKSDDLRDDDRRSGWDGFGTIGAAGGSFFKVLVFALIIVALALILYKMFGGSFMRNAKVKDSKIYSIEDIEERLHESDLDRMLREALQRGDYRLAVRIYYLAIIKELSLKDWIRWKKDKTNREYMNEMIVSKPDLVTGFRDATYAFEKVWYGDLEIREKEYEILSPRFRTFIDSIERVK